MERRTRQAVYRALSAVWAAYRLEETVCPPRMSAAEKQRWRDEQRVVEKALRRIP
jgi:hypothetical protein